MGQHAVNRKGLQAKLLGEGGLEPVDIEDYVEEQAHQW